MHTKRYVTESIGFGVSWYPQAECSTVPKSVVHLCYYFDDRQPILLAFIICMRRLNAFSEPRLLPNGMADLASAYRSQSWWEKAEELEVHTASSFHSMGR